MNKDIKEMQSALNKIDYYIWDYKETKDFEKEANEQIEILQKGLDNLDSALERKEKLEKFVILMKDYDCRKEIAVCKDCANWDYEEYVSLPCSKIFDKNEFNLLKEMLGEEE